MPRAAAALARGDVPGLVHHGFRVGMREGRPVFHRPDGTEMVRRPGVDAAGAPEGRAPP